MVYTRHISFTVLDAMIMFIYLLIYYRLSNITIILSFSFFLFFHGLRTYFGQCLVHGGEVGLLGLFAGGARALVLVRSGAQTHPKGQLRDPQPKRGTREGVRVDEK